MGNRDVVSPSPLHDSIVRKRQELADEMRVPLQELSIRCADVWPDRAALDTVLGEGLSRLPQGRTLYAMDKRGIQITSNVNANGLHAGSCGRDRSQRPYMNAVVPIEGLLLSGAFISQIGHRPSLTAVQVVRSSSGVLLGFIGVDFDLRDLPLDQPLYEEPVVWRQIKGDPSIRATVFHQNRVESLMDQHIDTVLKVVEELMVYHGVYHVILHFSSSRAVIWVMSDPYRYRLLDFDALVDPDMCLAYPKAGFPTEAQVPQERIAEVLALFRKLRYMDEMFYLRSGTLNLFNGLVGLTFSCDGSHYIPWQEFLDDKHDFWAAAS